MGLFDEAAAELARRASGAITPAPIPFETLAEILGGGLWPGSYVIAGPTGAGKTQLLLQLALHAAAADLRTTLVLPPDRGTDTPETAARLLGLLERRPWSSLLTGADREPINTGPLDRLPLSTNRTDDDARVVVSDGGTLPRRQPAQSVITTAHVKFDAPPRNIAAADAHELLRLLDHDPTTQHADAVIVVVPLGTAARNEWRPVRLAVCKVRHGAPAWVDVRFNGTWFEEEAEELELALT